ncbi:MAG: 16S rRNA (guanine(527)-N(7))-methyltransferase RsmG [Comamonadaceae bacterium]|nr:MAG: 16S rRNA (guanine(527)-N(7))-methyltransferase RsmG [Comamonadaceae bacterium]
MSTVLEAQRPALLQGAQALGLTLNDVQADQLLAYGALILKWNKVYNLTALRDPAAVLSHHLLDSLAAVPALNRERPGATQLLDVGAGAGLPGVVIAILRPDVQVHCLDAVAKKMAFVQQVASELKLPNLRGVHARVESWAGQYDVISSRAFASLGDFFTGSRHLLAPGGAWLAMKGKVPESELAGLPADLDVFHVEQLTVPGLDADRCIVWVRPSAT